MRREWQALSRTATPYWLIWDTPCGRAGTEHPVNARSPASGHLLLIASALDRAGTERPVNARSPASGHLLLIASALDRAGTEHPVNARSPASEHLLLIASALDRAGKYSSAVLHLLPKACHCRRCAPSGQALPDPLNPSVLPLKEY